MQCIMLCIAMACVECAMRSDKMRCNVLYTLIACDAMCYALWWHAIQCSMRFWWHAINLSLTMNFDDIMRSMYYAFWWYAMQCVMHSDNMRSNVLCISMTWNDMGFDDTRYNVQCVSDDMRCNMLWSSWYAMQYDLHFDHMRCNMLCLLKICD